jgi:HK97 gp10 family phage protein
VAGKSHVTVKGLDELGRKLAALPGIVERGARKAVHDETHETAQDMRRNAPRDTGGLVEGIEEQYAKSGLVGRAASTADYTTYVIHGTSTHKADDFIEPAGNRARNRFPGRVEQAVKEELRRMK